MKKLSRDQIIHKYEQELALRRYSKRTVRLYRSELEKFLDYVLRTPEMPR